jgi:lysophospholipase L1-like esterase
MHPAVLLSLLVPTAAPPAEYALRDGDTVVFLGDSITAARTYGKLIENYTLLRFPDRRVHFVNAGKGGDTAEGALKRLDADVFVHRPTVVTLALGLNDIGWGVYADEAHKKRYLAGVAGIAEACRKRGVRLHVCSGAVTAADPDKSEGDFFQTMCDEGLALARRKGARTIDVQRAMRTVQRKVVAHNKAHKTKESLHVSDGVHLSELGQVAMAWAILAGLGAPADVSSVRLDARRPRLVEARGCRVSDLAAKDGALAFTRLDRGLPLNHGLFFALHYRFVPLHELNRYLLRVENLRAGKYEARADGRVVGTFTAAQLGQGVNIASTTGNAWEPGGPWNAQANVLRELTDARHQLATGMLLSRAWAGGPLTSELARGADKVDADLVALQRAAARPRPYRFVVRPIP